VIEQKNTPEAFPEGGAGGVEATRVNARQNDRRRFGDSSAATGATNNGLSSRG
jgi:hypothetical protein